MKDNAEYIGEEFMRGNRVYIINDWVQCALCYDPKRPLFVTLKTRDGRTKKIDPRDAFLFDVMMEGEVASEEDFMNF